MAFDLNNNTNGYNYHHQQQQQHQPPKMSTSPSKISAEAAKSNLSTTVCIKI